MRLFEYFMSLVNPSQDSQVRELSKKELLREYHSDMDQYIRILQTLRESNSPIESSMRKVLENSIERLLIDIETLQSKPKVLSRGDSHNLNLKQIQLKNQYEWFFGKSG